MRAFVLTGPGQGSVQETLKSMDAAWDKGSA